MCSSQADEFIEEWQKGRQDELARENVRRMKSASKSLKSDLHENLASLNEVCILLTLFKKS